MTLLGDLSFAAGSSLLQTMIPAILLITSPKRSILRFLAIPCMIWIASQNLHKIDGFCQISIFIGGGIFLPILQSLDLLLINALDADDLIREAPERTKTFAGRFYYTMEMISCPRSVGTPRQAKGTPDHPAYYRDKKTGTSYLSRGTFILRQALVLIWQYAVLDLFQFASHQQGEGPIPEGVFTVPEWNVSFEQWVERGITHFIAWAVLARIMFDSRYRLASIIFVGLGIHSPSEWRPMFGTMKDAYTLRKCWGTFWHQTLRPTFTAVSNWIVRDIMRLPRSSILERYTNVFVVFFQSAMLHLLLDMLKGIPMQFSGSMPFFTIMTLGYMIEDGVQGLCKRMRGFNAQSASILKRIVGYIWVVLWVGVTSTWFIHPTMQSTPPNKTSLIPYSFSDLLGPQFVGGFTAIGGLILIFGLGGEV